MGVPVLAEVQGGSLLIERPGQSVPGVPGTRLEAGDLLRTPEGVTATISFAPERTGITVLPATTLKLVALSGGKRFDIGQGKVEASVARQRPFHPMTLRTPQAEARVLGTRFTLSVTSNATRLDVYEGKVRFTRKSDSMAVRVPAGHYAVAASNEELAPLPFTGGIRLEWWSGVSGKTINDLHTSPRFPDHPNGWNVAGTFELAPVETNGFAVCFRGYLHPPVTGSYEFWLATATDATLFMSPGENPVDAVTIATTQRFGAARDWNAPRFQGSSLWCPPMPLVAGRRYYIQAQVIIPKGEGHLSVAWKRPGGERELLTGEFLSPYTPK
jgi:hypothetical protein